MPRQPDEAFRFKHTQSFDDPREGRTWLNVATTLCREHGIAHVVRETIRDGAPVYQLGFPDTAALALFVRKVFGDLSGEPHVYTEPFAGGRAAGEFQRAWRAAAEMNLRTLGIPYTLRLNHDEPDTLTFQFERYSDLRTLQLLEETGALDRAAEGLCAAAAYRAAVAEDVQRYAEHVQRLEEIGRQYERAKALQMGRPDPDPS